MLWLDQNKIKAIIDEIDEETRKLTWFGNESPEIMREDPHDRDLHSETFKTDEHKWIKQHAHDKPCKSGVGKYNVDRINARCFAHVMHEAEKYKTKMASVKTSNENAASELDKREGSALQKELHAVLEALQINCIGDQHLVATLAHMEHIKEGDNLPCHCLNNFTTKYSNIKTHKPNAAMHVGG